MWATNAVQFFFNNRLVHSIIELQFLTPVFYALLAFNRKEAPCTNFFQIFFFFFRRLIGAGRISERCFDWEAGNKWALRGGERTFEEDKENDFSCPPEKIPRTLVSLFRLSCGISILYKISLFSLLGLAGLFI